jgi:hypothetical protein
MASASLTPEAANGVSATPPGSRVESLSRNAGACAVWGLLQTKDRRQFAAHFDPTMVALRMQRRVADQTADQVVFSVRDCRSVGPT